MDNLTKSNIKNLSDAKNYNKEITTTSFYESLNVYLNTGSQCIEYLLNSLKTKKKDYLIFIIKRGLDTISHIHNFLFIYTKNVELMRHHLEKGYLYYVEFVSQIGEDTHSYIKLNSKDASLFVYKKTIYEISNDHRKSMVLSDNDKKMALKMKSFTEIYNSILLNLIVLIKDKLVNCEKKLDVYIDYRKTFQKIVLNLYNIYVKKDYKLFYDFIKVFIYTIVKKNVSVTKYLKLLSSFTNKYLKKKTTSRNIVFKLSDIDHDKYFQMTTVKYINWLFI